MSLSNISLPQVDDAIWNCLDHHPLTSNLFRRKYRFRDEQDQQPTHSRLEPAPGDLPAIMLNLSQINPDKLTTFTDKDTLLYSINIWTPLWNEARALTVWEAVKEALYTTTHPQATLDTYISAPSCAVEPPGTGNLPQSFRLTLSQKTLLNVAENTTGTRAWLTQSELILHRNTQVFGRLRSV